MAQRANVDNHMIDGVPIGSFGSMFTGVSYTKKHSETMKTAISNPEEHLNKRIAMLTALENDLYCSVRAVVEWLGLVSLTRNLSLA